VAGGAPGVSAVYLEDVEAGLTVVVLSNYDEPLGELIGEQIFRTLRRDEHRSTAPERSSAEPKREAQSN
jgi:hypothetical protein